MITFADGPAKGQALHLARNPIYLRVVQDTSNGKWDALDQPDDTPTLTEVIYVYKIDGRPSSALVCSRSGPNKGCQHITWATYRQVKDQPKQPVLRDTTSWRAWAQAQPP